MAPTTAPTPRSFSIGQIVAVAPRTGPGENELGGIARILHSVPASSSYDVKFVLDGRIAHTIAVDDLQPHTFAAHRQQRAVLGRCRRCGSLRSDCGACDSTHRAVPQPLLLPATTTTAVVEDTSSSSSSDSSTDLQAVRRSQQRAFQRYKQRQAKALALLRRGRRKTKTMKQQPSRSNSGGILAAVAAPVDSSSDDEGSAAEASYLDATAIVPTQQDLEYESDDDASSSDNEPGTRTIVPTQQDLEYESDSSDNEPGAPVRQHHKHASSRPLVRTIGTTESSTEDETKASRRPALRRLPQAADDDSIASCDHPLNDDASFIQPEGNAEQLPADVVDATAHLSRSELVPFLRITMDRMETQVTAYEAQLQAYRSDAEDRMADDSQPQRPSAEQLHATMVHELVRNGLDQCSRALRRLGGQRVMAEVRLDQLSLTVETMIQRARQLAEATSDDDDSILLDDDDGWADPSESPVRGLADLSQRPMEYDDDDATTAVDPHPFATRRKKRKAAGSTMRRRNQQPTTQRSKRQQQTPMDRSKTTVHNPDEDAASDDADAATVPGTPNLPQRKRSRKLPPKRSRPVVQTGDGDASDNEEADIMDARRPRTRRQRRTSRRTAGPQRQQLTADDTTALQHFLDDGPIVVHANDDVMEPSMADRMEQWIERNASPDRSRRHHTASQKRERTQGRRQRNRAGTTRRDPERTNSRLPTSSNDVAFADLLSWEQQLEDAPTRETEGDDDTQTEAPQEDHAVAAHHISAAEDTVQRLDSLRLKLVRKGSKTLQEHMTSNNPMELRAFVSTMVMILRLLAQEQAKEHLASTNNGLFGKDSCAEFLDCVILQFVDAVMSLMHPQAWGTLPSTTLTTLRILAPLRNALGLHFLLAERVSRCILHELGVQEWYCATGGDRAFISSVNPAVWKALLETSHPAQRPPSQSRFATFTGFLPRCEVDVLWKFLAYCSCRKWTSGGRNESCRWQLLSQLFSKGSLSNECDSKLAPSQGQVDAATSDLTKVTELIKSGRLGELPRRDKFLFDIIHRAIVLHARSVQFNATNSARPHVAINTTKDEKEVIELLEGGDVQQLLHRGSSTPFALADRKWLNQLLYVPSSKTIQGCLLLAVEWRAKLPSDNTKRIQLFDRSMKTLATNLARENNSQEEDRSLQAVDSNDPFLGAFENDKQTSRSLPPASWDHTAVSKIEGAAFLTVLCCTPTVLQDNEGQARYVWELVSDKVMKERHVWMHGAGGSTTKPIVQCSNAARLELASKILTCLFLRTSGQVNGILGFSSPGTDVAAEFLCSVLAFILTCLDCSCDTSIDARTTAVIQCHLSTVVSTILKPCSPEGSDRWNVIANWLTIKGWRAIRKSDVFARSFQRVAGKELCGVEDDLSLQSLLVSIGKVASCLSKFQPEDSPGDNNCVEPPTIRIFELLEDALKNSKPSSRHSLVSSTSSLSTQGMCILNKRYSLVCRCLASLADPSLDFVTIQAWLSEVRFARRWDQDEDYRRKTGLAFLRNLVLRQQSSRDILKIFEGVRAEFLSCVITMVLDASFLLKIPSCNLGSMTASVESDIEEMAFDKLVSFGRGQSKLAIQLRESKRFLERVGGVFIGLGEATVGDAMISRRSAAEGMPSSLERECLEAFLLIVKIIDSSASSQQMRYEELVIDILWTTCSNLIEILLWADAHHVCAYDETTAESSGAYKQASFFECFSSYTELCISVLAYIFFRSAETNLSGSFVDILAAATERLLSPVLTRPELCLKSCLTSLLMTIGELDDRIPVRRQNPPSLRSSAREHKFVSIFRECITRRIGFFLHGTLCIPQLNQGSFVRSFFGRMEDKYSYCITVSALSTTRRNPTCLPESNSPIHRHLKSVLNDYYAACSFSDQRNRKTVELRFKLLELLVPRLGMRRSTQVATTVRAVLDVCGNEVDKAQQLPHRMLCSLVRGLWIAAQYGISGQARLHDDLLVECFLCAHSLLVLPASCVHAESDGRVVDIIQTSHRREDQYIFAAAKFLRGFGEEIVSGPSLLQLRAILRDIRNPTRQEVSWPLFASHGDETNTLSLRDLEQRLFGNGVTVVNVYATPCKPDFIEPFEPASKPTQKLRESIAKLVSLVKSELP